MTGIVFRRWLCCALAGCGLWGCRTPPPEPGTGVVVGVVDGDTIDVRLGVRRETVRLLGIDTPETVDPSRPVGCYGPEASDRTRSLLPEGTAIRLERDVELRDHFGRVLAYVTRVRDGLDVNRSLVASGFADTLWIAPNHAHRAAYGIERDRARAGELGAWGACAKPFADDG